MSVYLRADRAVFRFSGADAHKLLNDVVTGHVPAEDGPGAWWALLSPQGKIMAEGRTKELGRDAVLPGAYLTQACAHAVAPPPLVEWWSLEASYDHPLTHLNVVLPPDELVKHDGMTTFGIRTS